MEELLHRLKNFNSVTSRSVLQLWARQAEQQLDNLDVKERAFYILVLSEFQAIYLRDIDLAYETLKKIQLNTPLLSQEVKVRRCFYKYLEGAYEFALEYLQDIIQGNNSPCSHKIAVDFFSRILFKDIFSSFAKGKQKMEKIESYEAEYLSAIKQEKSGLLKIARDIHISLFARFEDSNETIRYESAKHILMLIEKEKSKPNREEMQKYMDVVAGFERGVSNKNYYKMKVNFLFDVLDFIDPQKERQDDMLIDFQVAKKFIISSIEAALSKEKNAENRRKLSNTLDGLKGSREIAEQICYKFIGDKMYEKLLQKSEGGQDKSKVIRKQSRTEKKNVSQIDQQHYKSNQKNNIDTSAMKKNKMKQTESRYEDRSVNPQFTGSTMTKVNMNSGGFEDRYFYMKQDFKSTMKLYYCSKKGKETGSDDFYRLKGLKKMTFGKKSDALKRSECQQFQEDRCFTLYISSDETYQRNFYVKEEDDYHNWVAIFQRYLINKQYDSNTKKTKLIIP